MILIDTNLLLYSHDTSAAQHAGARSWLEKMLSSGEPVALAWVTILAFVRVGTSARMLREPLEMPEAISIVNDWLALPNVSIPHPGERHWEILSDLLSRFQVWGGLVTDAHLAALAIEHGCTLCTNDRDFSRFEGLRVQYPLARQ